MVVKVATLRVGFIGAGFSARLHAKACHQVRGVGVVLTRVAAARSERAARFAEELGIGAVAASAEEVLAAPNVDVVDLCVPTTLHAPLAIKAGRAGKHVIVEKALTGSFAPTATPRAEMLKVRVRHRQYLRFSSLDGGCAMERHTARG